MQQIFHTTKTPEEYQQLGRDFPFPVPDHCPNPGCLVKSLCKGMASIPATLLPKTLVAAYQLGATIANIAGKPYPTCLLFACPTTNTPWE